MSVWALSPADPVDPTDVVRFVPAATSTDEMINQVGEIWLWVGLGALAFRTVHLFFLRDVQTGLVWITKIVTDPFQDIKTYWKAPLYPDARGADRPDARERPRARRVSDRTRRRIV